MYKINILKILTIVNIINKDIKLIWLGKDPSLKVSPKLKILFMKKISKNIDIRPVPKKR